MDFRGGARTYTVESHQVGAPLLNGAQVLARVNSLPVEKLQIPPSLHFGKVVKFWVEIKSRGDVGLWRSCDYNMNKLCQSRFLCQPSRHVRTGRYFMPERDAAHPGPNLRNVWVGGISCVQCWTTCPTALRISIGPLNPKKTGVDALGIYNVPTQDGEVHEYNMYMSPTRNMIEFLGGEHPLLHPCLVTSTALPNGANLSEDEIRAGVRRRGDGVSYQESSRVVETHDAQNPPKPFAMPVYFASSFGGGAGEKNAFTSLVQATSGQDELTTYCRDSLSLQTMYERYLYFRKRHGFFGAGPAPINPVEIGKVTWLRAPDSEYTSTWSRGESPDARAGEEMGVREPLKSELDLLDLLSCEVNSKHPLSEALAERFRQVRPNSQLQKMDNENVCFFPVTVFEHVAFTAAQRRAEAGADKAIHDLHSFGVQAVPAFPTSSSGTNQPPPQGQLQFRAAQPREEPTQESWQCGLLINLVYFPCDVAPGGESVVDGSVVPSS